MLIIKQGSSGAKITGIKPEMAIALLTVVGIYHSHNSDCRLTCGTDGVHKEGSLHYVGYAIDIGLPATLELQGVILIELKRNLDDEFDIVYEGDHFHIEFQPKKALNKT